MEQKKKFTLKSSRMMWNFFPEEIINKQSLHIEAKFIGLKIRRERTDFNDWCWGKKAVIQ